MRNNDGEEKRRSRNAPAFLAAIAILVASTVVFFAVRVQSNIVDDAAANKEIITFLFIIHDRGIPVVCETVMINPENGRAAFIDLPPEAGDLLMPVNRSDRYAALFDKDDLSLYVNELNRLFGEEYLFPLLLPMDALSDAVDLLGGVSIYNAEEIDAEIDGNRYLISAGSVLLDGDKTKEYLRYPLGEITVAEAQNDNPGEMLSRVVSKRNIGFARSLFFAMRDRSSKEYIEELYPYFSTPLSSSGFSSLVELFALIDVDNIASQNFLGIWRETGILFPRYQLNFIHDRIKGVKSSLQNSGGGQYSGQVTVEVLNGTDRSRLAANCAEYLGRKFTVLNIDNADRNNYEQTVVFNLTGNSEAARRVAEELGCDLIEENLNATNLDGAMVRVILGKDYNGSTNRVFEE